MSQTPPPGVDELPANMPSINDPTTFAPRADAAFGALPNFRAQLVALALNVYNNAVDCYNNAVAATASAATTASLATSALTSANNAAASAGAVLWVSGTTYTQGAHVRSINSRIYRRTTASGSGTTDPSADTANYTPVFLDISSGLPTSRPSLILDFANSEQVDPRITSTRASTATRINKFGLVETVAANVPRIDYDPTTGRCKGLLREPAKTNLLLYSEQFDNAAWTKTNCNVTANAIIAPGVSSLADKIVENTTNSSHHIYQGYTAASPQLYVYYVFLKAAERSVVTIELSNAWTGGASATFNLSTGVIATAASSGGDLTNAAAIIIPCVDGWCFCALLAIKGSANSNVFPVILLTDGINTVYTGDGVSGVYAWGAQLETAQTFSSYIPTTSAAVTRSADVFEMTGANFSDWYNQNEGTFVASGDMAYVNSNNPTLFEVSDGSPNNRHSLRMVGNELGYEVASGGTGVVDLATGNIVTANIPLTIAITYKVNNFVSTFNGENLLNDTTGAVPTGINKLTFGDGAAGQMSGHIYNLSYYTKQSSNVETLGLSS